MDAKQASASVIVTNSYLLATICREAKLTNPQRKLLGIPVTVEDADAPHRHRLTQPTQAAPSPQPLKSPLGAPNVSMLIIGFSDAQLYALHIATNHTQLQHL